MVFNSLNGEVLFFMSHVFIRGSETASLAYCGQKFRHTPQSKNTFGICSLEIFSLREDSLKLLER